VRSKMRRKTKLKPTQREQAEEIIKKTEKEN
jgi:hypothetical protein